MQDGEAYTRVLSVRGRSGAVLALEPSVGESPPHIVACLQTCLPQAGLLQVEHLATDSPNENLLAELTNVCPNLKALSLDPTHAAMKYEQALVGKRSAGSRLLRSFFVKFTAHDPNVESNIWGPFYAGGPVPEVRQEANLRQHILDVSMSKARARRILQSAEQLLIWPTRIQFIEAVAALAALHSDDMQKKIDGSKFTVAKFLYKLTAADKVEWLTNNLRYRQFLPASRRILLPSGTTANEALHAELSAWYKQVQQMHRSTLALKLGTQTIGKLLSHQTALHWPTTVQMPHAMVLAAATTKPLCRSNAKAE